MGEMIWVRGRDGDRQGLNERERTASSPQIDQGEDTQEMDKS